MDPENLHCVCSQRNAEQKDKTAHNKCSANLSACVQRYESSFEPGCLSSVGRGTLQQYVGLNGDRAEYLYHIPDVHFHLAVLIYHLSPQIILCDL